MTTQETVRRSPSHEPRAANHQQPATELPPSGKRVFVHQLFTTIAPRYDWFNRLASLNLDRGWRDRAVRTGELSDGMRVLDVCSGTGDLALLCAKRTGPDGVVVGLDFNQPMLQGARRKQVASRVQVTWLLGDAQSLPFREGTFDRVFIGFSTRNLSNLRQGMQEMLRVLKPRGQLIVLETGRPSNRLMRAGYWLFLRTVVRAIGLVLTGRLWPFTYLANSVKGFLSPPEFVALLTACGARAEYRPLSRGLASLYIAQKPAGVEALL